MVLIREKDIEDGEIRERYIYILGHVDIKKEKVLHVLEKHEVKKSPGAGIYPRILKEAREEIDQNLCSSFTMGEEPEG